MPDSASPFSGSVRVLRRFFARRLRAEPTPPSISRGRAQVIRHLSEQALGRAALRSVESGPRGTPPSADDWKAFLRVAALTELRAHG